MINSICKFGKRLTQVKYILLCALVVRLRKVEDEPARTRAMTQTAAKPRNERCDVSKGFAAFKLKVRKVKVRDGQKGYKVRGAGPRE